MNRRLATVVVNALLVALAIVSIGPLAWSADQAVAIGDANAEITTVLEQYLGMDSATSMDEFQAVHAELQGVPWVNTIATSADGRKGVAQVARCAIDGGGEAEVALGWSTPAETVRWQGGDVSGIIAPNGVLHAAQVRPGLERLAPPDPSDLPNNHLMYAGQWFFFALTALAIYGLALRRRWLLGAAEASGRD